MDKKNRKVACFMALVMTAGFLSLNACAPITLYHGNEVPDKKLQRLTPHKSTAERVSKTLGTPHYVSFDGKRLWLYFSKETHAWLPTFENEANRRVVAIHFNPKGIMTRKKIYTLAEARNLSYATEIVPSPIPELNWVQKLFSNIGRVTPSGVPGSSGP